MARYKVLKSVAHNLGHSFLSDMNYVPDRQQRTVMVPQRIYDLAREHGLARVEVDFTSESIFPTEFGTPEVRDAVGRYRSSLRRLVESQGADWSMVSAVTLELRFDLSKQRRALGLPDTSIPIFRCRVEILDDRGRVHVGEPSNWWTGDGGVMVGQRVAQP